MTYTNKQKIEIIERAIKKVEISYCIGELALNEHGTTVHPLDPNACSWCALGAMVASNKEKYQETFDQDKKFDDYQSDIYDLFKFDELINELGKFIDEGNYIVPTSVSNSFELIYRVNDQRGHEEVIKVLRDFIEHLKKD